MMTRPTAAASVVMFSVPFILLAVVYTALPSELAVLRRPFGGGVLVAPKSAFTVFRVPVMNLTQGLMAAVMLSGNTSFSDTRRRASYSRVFLTLLFAVAFKSIFEALEMTAFTWSFGMAVPWLTGGTIVSVIGGLGLAFVHSRGVSLPWPELCLANYQKVSLGGLFLVYVAIVVATLLISHRA